MQETLQISEEEITVLMRECQVTRNQAIEILQDIARNTMQYQAYLESGLDPRD